MIREFTYHITEQDIQKAPSGALLTIQGFLKSLGYSHSVIVSLKRTPQGIVKNGVWARTGDVLHASDTLQIRIEETLSSANIVPIPLPFPVVYEDADLLVINKPSGMPIHPSQGNYDNTLANAAAYYYQQKKEPFIYRCINRLDRDTTGLLILAKHSYSASLLSQMVANRDIHREYLAVVKELSTIPQKMKEVLMLNDSIAQLSQIFTYAHNFIYLGRGYNYPVALEGALKLKEISYIHAEGYPAAEMKHGPIALVDAEMPVIVIATQNGLYEKVLSNIQEIKARKGRVIALVTKGDTVISKIADTCIELPATLECLDPLITTVPLQLLAYHIAVCKGMDVDQPRNLAKSVTVE